MAKLVCHVEKFKKSSVPSLERHNERKNSCYSNDEIDRDKKDRNYNLIERNGETYMTSVMDLVEERYNPTGRNLRKDAVVLCEIIISSGNDFFAGLSDEEQRSFFQDASCYLQDVFGADHCIYAKVHMDEHTPHMHFGFVPLTDDNRLCAKEVVNRETLIRLQSEMPEILKGRGFQIERGDLASVAVHRTVKRYKADMEKEKAALAVNIQSQKQELKKITDVKSDIKAVEQIPTGKTVFGGKVTVEETDYKKVTALAKKQIAGENREKKLAKEVSELKKENRELKSKNSALSSEILEVNSISKRLSVKKMEIELAELRKFKAVAEKFIAEHGLLDYFKKHFIHSTNREI